MPTTQILTIHRLDLRRAGDRSTCTSSQGCGMVAAWRMAWPTQSRFACDQHMANSARRAIEVYSMGVEVKPA